METFRQCWQDPSITSRQTPRETCTYTQEFFLTLTYLLFFPIYIRSYTWILILLNGL